MELWLVRTYGYVDHHYDGDVHFIGTSRESAQGYLDNMIEQFPNNYEWMDWAYHNEQVLMDLNYYRGKYEYKYYYIEKAEADKEL